MHALRFLLILLSLYSLPFCPAQAAQPKPSANRSILVFGDSLSAGYGLPTGAAWPDLLAERLKNGRADYNVINLSLSGETTGGGKNRLTPALEKQHPAIVILALGANDGLRGLSLAVMQDNLRAMLARIRAEGGSPLLVGMRLPPNYGPYAAEFETAFRRVAQESRTPFVPFLLDGIADQPALFQADGLHPTREAQGKLLDNVWPGLQPLLK